MHTWIQMSEIGSGTQGEKTEPGPKALPVARGAAGSSQLVTTDELYLDTESIT